MRLCLCGKLVRYSNEDRCEDCFIEDTLRYSGKSERVESLPWLEGDDDEDTPTHSTHNQAR